MIHILAVILRRAGRCMVLKLSHSGLANSLKFWIHLLIFVFDERCDEMNSCLLKVPIFSEKDPISMRMNRKAREKTTFWTLDGRYRCAGGVGRSNSYRGSSEASFWRAEMSQRLEKQDHRYTRSDITRNEELFHQIQSSVGLRSTNPPLNSILHVICSAI